MGLDSDNFCERRPFYIGVIFILSAREAPHIDNAHTRKHNTESHKTAQIRDRHGVGGFHVSRYI